MKKLISVTQNHINSGQKCAPYNCPVALALYEQVKYVKFISVNHKYCSIDFKRHELSNKTKIFILKFDKNLPVVPFKFYINLREEINENYFFNLHYAFVL